RAAAEDRGQPEVARVPPHRPRSRLQIRRLARLSFPVVSAFRRTSRSPAKAGRYELQKTPNRSVTRLATCAPSSTASMTRLAMASAGFISLRALFSIRRLSRPRCRQLIRPWLDPCALRGFPQLLVERCQHDVLANRLVPGQR